MSSSIQALKEYVTSCYEGFVNMNRERPFIREDDETALERKQIQLRERGGEIVKNIIDGYLISERTYDNKSIIDYGLMIKHVIRQKENLYIEEQQIERRAVIENGLVTDDYLLSIDGDDHRDYLHLPKLEYDERRQRNISYSYDRLAAVKYAERWWNSYNPAYRQFTDDCTNFISQCMYAGGAPMTGQPNRGKGWWYAGPHDQWSYSWTVAHSLRWYLNGSNEGLQAREVSSPNQLFLGDVICYDFDGDGRWQHTTIVTAKDEQNMPLVNAHTANSRMRYWAYEDSTAWTENIKYKFFHILDR